ncbi:hypothetical protein, variant [Verruconis gallopava]|uniref:RRM domain-containing protein n=1 Tax=Verruconis gallopava TaxID=253628 RepID=A0A0D2BCZ2_9PEZI|nr:uncharacterized protein PV09_00219 [Verruconis gallopava]XP_016219173.1 hypothetical protein, variant [Verruconis gallopava]KIW09303.1 hypothetical protein PV09_00219 [Verruconis gallopava]KIW09304.1 hypothetical protein, variant [Verruconis gallopava]
MSSAASNTQSMAQTKDESHLLSYPVKPVDACVVTSDPEHWGRLTSWDIREHDLERWLDASPGAKPEDFWTENFILFRGRPYCEAALRAIVMWNHEEIGGHAVMFMDQILMWQPHYFPYAMRYRCSVDELFEPDQIKHYGRVFLEKIVEWCKLTYLKNQAYWDAILANPPSGLHLKQFIADVKANHYPAKLKEMKIVPEDRPDEWPAVYFARARGKSVEPLSFAATRFQKTQNSEAERPESCQDQPAGVQLQKTCGNDAKETYGAGSVPPNNDGGAVQIDTAAISSNAAAAKASDRDRKGESPGDNTEAEDKKADVQISQQPQAPKGKKPAVDGEISVSEPISHRRVKSDFDGAVKELRKSTLSLSDWMTAPGVERRAISTQSQSELITKATVGNGQKEVPPHNRGGAEKVIGRYEYRLGNPPLVFQHSSERNVIAINNAAYLYHHDRSFGRQGSPLLEHPTTNRPGSSICKVDPRRGGMIFHSPKPEPHFSQPRGRNYPIAQSGSYMGHIGSPRMGYPARSVSTKILPQGQQVMKFSIVPSAPFGTVPGNIMTPHVVHAQHGAWPETPAPLPQAGQSPRHVGIPPIRNPSRYIMRVPPPQTMHNSPQLLQQHCLPNHVQPPLLDPTQHMGMSTAHDASARHVAHATSNSFAGEHVGRRSLIVADASSFSPSDVHIPHIRCSGLTSTNRFVDEQSIVMPSRSSRPARRLSNASQVVHRSSIAGDIVPFPSYTEKSYTENTVDLANMTERQQCTSGFIGPDAEDVVTLWFGNIPIDTTVDQLKAFVSITVPVAEVKSPITFDPSMNAGLGWTFVKFHSNADARKALRELHHAEFNGGNLKVQVPERRTREGIERRARRRSSFGRYNRSKSFGQVSGYTGYQAQVNSGGIFTRYEGIPVIFDPRSTRGGSMSQAIHAVRRNSAFTQQDARSDLPLGDLKEDTEPPSSHNASSCTNAPIQAAETIDQVVSGDVEALLKPIKKKHRRKKPSRSREASITPSESNISSPANGSSSSRGYITPADKDKVKEKFQSSLISLHVESKALERNQTIPSSHTAETAPLEDSQTTEYGRSLNTVGHFEVHDRYESFSEQPEGTETISGLVYETKSMDQAFEPHKVMLTTNPSLDGTATPLFNQSEIMGMSEPIKIQGTQSVFSTDMHDHGKAVRVKSLKEKGAAQTESLSIYNKKSKAERDAEKKKAKKQRQASRKISKISTDVPESKMEDRIVEKTPKKQVCAAAVEFHSAPTVISEHVEGKTFDGKVKHLPVGPSGSSSLPATPTTAREHLSSPRAPTAEIHVIPPWQGNADSVTESCKGKFDDFGSVFDGGLARQELEQVATAAQQVSVGDLINISRATNAHKIVQPSDQGFVSTKLEPPGSQVLCPLEHSFNFALSSPKKMGDGKGKGGKTSSNKTYAEAAKNIISPEDSTAPNTLGLTERDVNVLR